MTHILSVAPPVAAMVAAIVVVSAPALHAQQPGTAPLDTAGSVVSGFVYDSVQSAPIAGATVQLVSETSRAAFTTTSDSTGHYRIAHVPPGTYDLGFLDESLAELGLGAVQRRILVEAGAIVDTLATPSARAVRATICGRTASADSSGMLVGFVRDAETGVPIGLTTVVAMWREVTIGAGGLTRGRRQVPAKADSVGWFAICGLPTDGPIAVRAESGKRASGFIEVSLPPRGVAVRDLGIGRDTAVAATRDSAISPLGDAIRHGRARVLGTVRDSTGRVLAGAHVTVWGSGVTGVTDDAGRFDLHGLPAGTHTLESVYLGLEPLHIVLDLSESKPDTVRLTMARPVPVLAGVNVYSKHKRVSSLDEFLARQKTGIGSYYTGDEITKARPFELTDFFYKVPGMRVQPTSNFDYTLVATRTGGGCSPAIFVDGIQVVEGATALNETVRPEDVRAMEVYADANTVPPQYRKGDCGAVIIWTR